MNVIVRINGEDVFVKRKEKSKTLNLERGRTRGSIIRLFILYLFFKTKFMESSTKSDYNVEKPAEVGPEATTARGGAAANNAI